MQLLTVPSTPCQLSDIISSNLVMKHMQCSDWQKEKEGEFSFRKAS